MKIIRYPLLSEYSQILTRPTASLESLEEQVGPILKSVREQGDSAIIEFSQKFDGHKLNSLKVTENELNEAALQVPEDLKKAVQVAIDNVYAFHFSQKEEIKYIETIPGVTCWRKSVPIQKVGLYIPGGTAPLFSTVIMLGVPAILAGCEEIVLCSPADRDGKINPVILYVANLLGIKSVFKVGGAQAIAGMAFGTETITKVFKIFGPGNQYVTTAKQMVTKYGVAIDMPAGPSEVMVVADNTSNPVFVAADLLSQTEHGVDSQVVLLSTNELIINQIKLEVDKQSVLLSRSAIALKALENSKIILVKTNEEIIDLINEYAPEHLILSVSNPDIFADKIINAGSVFLGHFTPEAAGDYASGTNHTLPTNGYAKAYSGVSLDSFIKKITFQKITEEGIRNIGPSVEIMAQNEYLDAHKNAISVRLNYLK
ncbi:MAG: histidinol dehydrogenase [Opitutaceae bacterium]|nr:histidinol dehydrogenase [Cytophagales bacterium]